MPNGIMQDEQVRALAQAMLLLSDEDEALRFFEDIFTHPHPIIFNSNPDDIILNTVKNIQLK